MTARLIFEATLIELSKVLAPSLKLYEFNYLFNKAINLYVNKIYNIYDINLLTTDDLRVLKSTAYLTPRKVELGKSTTDSALKNLSSSGKVESTGNLDEPREGYTGLASSYLSKANRSIQSLHGATYEIYLPMDYLHMLNCVCIYYVAKLKDCWDAGSYIEVPAYRLTADSWSLIINDIYNRPSPMKPYYYIHNINQYLSLPTDPNYNISGKNGFGVGTDLNGNYNVTDADGGELDGETTQTSNFQRTFKLNTYNSEGVLQELILVSLVEKPTALRVGNTSNVRCEIRYGKDDSLFLLVEVLIDYIKCPLFIRLTLELIDLTEDTSQIMEFPDYVNQEIINELVHLVMERVNDPRLGNNMLITLSIARPTGQLQQPTPNRQE